ncbi:MAG TPA: cupin, partial [Acidimicrobiia bacterium]|nr:cupin [Acidimicrobiia bacterium]
LSGELSFDFGPQGSESVAAGPGDFVHVPKGLIHREVNSAAEEGAVVLFRMGSGPPVINVDGPGGD